MYKKRFAKWGFQKNCGRSDTAVSTLATKNVRKRLFKRTQRPSGEPYCMPTFLKLGHDDRLRLGFLVSVRTWSFAFFESVNSCDARLACNQERTPVEKPWSEKARETSFTLKLVSDLLDRGHGALAGRIARKAFLLIEDLLMLEGPALAWNLLEILYYMVTLHHEQLFQILLAHLIALINGRVAHSHPLSTMLHHLQRLVVSLASGAFTTGSSSFSSSSSSSPSTPVGQNATTKPSHSSLFSHAIPPLLKEAWVLNAELLFDHFDPRLFWLYFHLHWESCSIGVPSGIIDMTKQWLRHIDAKQMSRAVAAANRAKDAASRTQVEEDIMLQRLLTPRTDASPPQDYEMLRASSVATLGRYGKSLLRAEAVPKIETATTLQILPALVKARLLEEVTIVVEQSDTASSDTTKVSRTQAANVACLLRALMDLNIKHSGRPNEALPGTIERIRSILALREYASSEINPQVMREMWLLEDALVAAGEREKAREIGQSVIKRLEKYAQDIPLDSA